MPEEAYPSQLQKKDKQQLQLTFLKGELISIDNQDGLPQENIEKLIRSYNFRYNIMKIEKINSFELNSLNLRSYYHNNILAFGDLLHRVHPLAGQGFNMTIRDMKILI